MNYLQFILAGTFVLFAAFINAHPMGEEKGPGFGMKKEDWNKTWAMNGSFPHHGPLNGTWSFNGTLPFGGKHWPKNGSSPFNGTWPFNRTWAMNGSFPQHGPFNGTWHFNGTWAMNKTFPGMGWGKGNRGQKKSGDRFPPFFHSKEITTQAAPGGLEEEQTAPPQGHPQGQPQGRPQGQPQGQPPRGNLFGMGPMGGRHHKRHDQAREHVTHDPSVTREPKFSEGNSHDKDVTHDPNFTHKQEEFTRSQNGGQIPPKGDRGGRHHKRHDQPKDHVTQDPSVTREPKFSEGNSHDKDVTHDPNFAHKQEEFTRPQNGGRMPSNGEKGARHHKRHDQAKDHVTHDPSVTREPKFSEGNSHDKDVTHDPNFTHKQEEFTRPQNGGRMPPNGEKGGRHHKRHDQAREHVTHDPSFTHEPKFSNGNSHDKDVTHDPNFTHERKEFTRPQNGGQMPSKEEKGGRHGERPDQAKDHVTHDPSVTREPKFSEGKSRDKDVTHDPNFTHKQEEFTRPQIGKGPMARRH